MTHGSVEGDPPYLKPQPHIMASEANRERTRERAVKPPHALTSPFTCGSRATSRDAAEWRACSQAKDRQ